MTSSTEWLQPKKHSRSFTNLLENAKKKEDFGGLTSRERQVFLLLKEAYPDGMTKAEIHRRIKGDKPLNSVYVEVHVCHLRQKMKLYGYDWEIETIKPNCTYKLHRLEK